MDPRSDCGGEGVCTGTCNGQGACRWGPQGASLRDRRVPGDDRRHHGRRHLRRRRSLQHGADPGLQGLPLLHRYAGDGPVRDGLLARSGVRARLLLPEHERRRRHRQRRGVSVPARSSISGTRAIATRSARPARAATASAATSTATSAVPATFLRRSAPVCRSPPAPIPKASARTAPAIRPACARGSATARRAAPTWRRARPAANARPATASVSVTSSPTTTPRAASSTATV